MFGVRKDGVSDTNSDGLTRSKFGRSAGESKNIFRRESYTFHPYAKHPFVPNVGKRESRISGSEKQQRAEEKRLLGNYATDPDAVRITPGGTSADKPKPTSLLKSFSTFQPTNTLGPRPSKPISRTHDNATRSPYFASLKPNTHAISDNENSNHPRKKQKTEMPKEVIEIDDDKPTSPTPVAKPTSPIRSLISQRPTAGGYSHPKQRAIPAISEYMDVEKQVRPFGAIAGRKEWRNYSGDEITDDFDPEGFTRGSRNGRTSHTAVPATSRESPRERHRKGFSIMSAVEIPKTCKEGKNCKVDESEREDTVRRRLALRESPDELQGDRTIDDSWRTKARSERAVSSSDIRPTCFSTSSKQRKLRERPKKKDSLEATFTVKMFRCGADVIDEPVHLVVGRDERNLVLGSTAKHPSHKTFDLRKVYSVSYDDRDDHAKVRLKFSKSADTEDEADMIFPDGKESRRFCELVKNLVPAVKGVPRESRWMDCAFNITLKRNLEQASDLKRQSPKEITQSTEPNASSPTQKRSKLSDKLLNGIVNMASKFSTSKNEQQTLEGAWGSKGLVTPSEPESHAPPKASGLDEGIPIPVKTYKGTRSSAHVTRSKTRHQRIDIDSEDDVPSETSLSSDKGKRWCKPLVYPKVGKKRAEVEAYDLSRLRDGEFLNDNLIGLYVRFLEHHLQRQHPDNFKRIYFFNSYFFASLTNSPKGKRVLNYQGVEKWTRFVDIFSFDYVVVPINENAHWYMAIICNLPALFEPKPDDHDGNEEPSTPKIINTEDEQGASHHQVANDDRDVISDIPGADQSVNGKEGKLTLSFDTMTLSDKLAESSSQASPRATPKAVESADKDEWPEEDENQVPASSPNKDQASPSGQLSQSKSEQNADDKSSKSKSKKKRSQKPRLSLQKYQPRQPVIITFDSLGCSRSPTIRILREYLEEEAKSKRSTTIDSKEIKGMTAQQIPQQPNFSDCGLYLLVYLEKFIQDPDTFIKKLLQREMDKNKDWPILKSGVLRRRLRSFLNELYDEEDRKEQVGPLLVDSKPLDILLVDADVDKPAEEEKSGESEKPNLDKDLSSKELERSSKPSPEDPPPEPITVIPAGDKVDEEKMLDKRSPTPADLPSAREHPAEDKQSSPVAVDIEHRHQSPDSLLDDIEEAVLRGPCESETGRYKDVVQIPETPPRERASPEAHRSSRDRIISSPFLLSPSKHLFEQP